MPTLLQGSAQRTFITKFKQDPEDKTIGISVLIIKSPNGDYDGDELNFTILLDNLMGNEFKTLDPHYNIPDLNKPYSVSGNLGLLSPATSILTSYLSRKDADQPELDIISKYLEPVPVEILP